VCLLTLSLVMKTIFPAMCRYLSLISLSSCFPLISGILKSAVNRLLILLGVISANGLIPLSTCLPDE